MRTARVLKLLCYAIKCQWNGSGNWRSLSSLTFFFTSDCLFESCVIGQFVRWVCVPLWSVLEFKATNPAGVLVTAVFLVLGGLRRWWVGTRSLTKHGSRRRRLFGRCRAGVVSGRGVLVVGVVRGWGLERTNYIENFQPPQTHRDFNGLCNNLSEKPKKSEFGDRFPMSRGNSKSVVFSLNLYGIWAIFLPIFPIFQFPLFSPTSM